MKTIPDIRQEVELLSMLGSSTKPLIVIVGHTASGKTGFSIDLALKLKKLCAEQTLPWKDVEITNADSRQFYKGFDIGTAKITGEEKRGVVHHLLDVLDGKEPVTISWFKKEAEKCIAECHTRNVIPILVGGSMLYISSIIDGLEPVDAVDHEKRKALSDAYDVDHGLSLWKKLSELDPDGAAGIERRNKMYVIRAMEIVESTGKPLAQVKTQNPCPYDLFLYGLSFEPEERAKRINERTRQLLESGWVEEVQKLMAAGYDPMDPAMISHGYREISSKLKTQSSELNINKDEIRVLAEEISAKTRQYAKRQVTWWKNDARIHWLAQ